MDSCALDLNASRNDVWKDTKIGLNYNIGSGNGLVPSGNKPLPDPMLTENKHMMIISTSLQLESAITKLLAPEK